MAAFQQIPGRNTEHEDGCRDIARRNGVNELGLRDLIEHDVEERGHLHAHRQGIERGAYRVLHPAIGDQDPERREVRSDGNQPGDDQMRALGKPIPAEEEEADKGCFEEEGHQALDRQRRAENVADIVAVIAPVHAELEFHRDAGGHPQHEVDAEQGSPEFGHLSPDRPVGHDIDCFHDRDDHGKSQCQRHEQEVIERCHCKLQS